MSAKGKNMAKMTVAVLLVGLFLCLGATALQAGSCERAFMNCINDPYWMGIFAPVFCVNGYVFCKKYIDP